MNRWIACVLSRRACVCPSSQCSTFPTERKPQTKKQEAFRRCQCDMACDVSLISSFMDSSSELQPEGSFHWLHRLSLTEFRRLLASVRYWLMLYGNENSHASCSLFLSLAAEASKFYKGLLHQVALSMTLQRRFAALSSRRSFVHIWDLEANADLKRMWSCRLQQTHSKIALLVLQRLTNQ